MSKVQGLSIGKATGGLAKKMREAQAGERIIDVPLGDIAPDPDQPRQHIDKDALSQLAESIKTQGIHQPIVIWSHSYDEIDAPYMIVFGERRWRAARIAGLKTIKAVVRDYTDDDIGKIRSAQVVENLQREDMTVTEVVNAVGRLVDQFGNGQTAEQIGKPKGWVSKITKIYRGGIAVREALASNWSSDVEALYSLAGLEAKSEKAALTLVHNASSSDGVTARESVANAMRSLEGKASDKDAPSGAAEKKKKKEKPDQVFTCFDVQIEQDKVVFATDGGRLVFEKSVIDMVSDLESALSS